VASPSYSDWLDNVKRLLKKQRPDIDPKQLDPNECYAAFSRGDTPFDFVRNPVLPLMPHTSVSTQSHPRPHRVKAIDVLVGVFLLLWASFIVTGTVRVLNDNAKIVAEREQLAGQWGSELAKGLDETVGYARIERQNNLFPILCGVQLLALAGAIGLFFGMRWGGFVIVLWGGVSIVMTLLVGSNAPALILSAITGVFTIYGVRVAARSPT